MRLCLHASDLDPVRHVRTDICGLNRFHFELLVFMLHQETEVARLLSLASRPALVTMSAA